MTFHFKTLGALSAIALLAACGGGGGDGPQTVFQYQTFASEVPGISTIAAAGLTQNDPDSGLPDGTIVLTGEIDRESRTLTLGNVVINGEEVAKNVWRSDSEQVNRIPDFANERQFLLPVTLTNLDGNTFARPFIIGVVSRTQDLPDSGSFTVNGEALVNSTLDGGGTGLASSTKSAGVLTLTAQFSGAGNVNVDISELQDMPFDKVVITNLAIDTGDNATFNSNGSSLVTFSSGADTVDPIADPSLSASGAFFGGGSAGPIEAGGVFSVDGAAGNIYGIFAGGVLNR